MYKITAPEKFYKGVTSGIVFVNGTATAELDAFTKDWFISKGYEVEEIKTTAAPQGKSNEDPNAGKNTDNQGEKPLTKAELVEKAKALGIENIKNKITNAELEELIANKEAELKAAELEKENEGESGNVDPEAGKSNEDPNAGEQGKEDPEKGE
ncbi:MAG: hypothetical protein J5982_03345 [Bacilli bacterium]|nr:hypothetical protein [Bacilli bacterium]